MRSSPLFLIVPLIFTLPGVSGGKILVYPEDASHWVNMKVLIEELHLRGHSVFVMRPPGSWYVRETSPHYTSITINGTGVSEEFWVSFASKLLRMQRQGTSFWKHLKTEIEMMRIGRDIVVKEYEMLIQMFENQELMESLRMSQYDMVLTDPAVAGGVLLAHYLSVPVVYNVRWTIMGEGHFAIAPSPLSYVPLPGPKLTDTMNFFQRVENMITHCLTWFYCEYYLNPPLDHLVHRYISSELNFIQLLQAADIWLMRVDFVFEFPRPTMPNVVYMGGFQCKPAKPLPEDLEEFVESSGEHGVIIMSLGTLFSELPHELADEVAAAFAQLPQKVIWRHAGDPPATLGNNTRLVSWMPQNDLLGHPKIRVLVAHGGTNGILEAIYHGIPIVGLPLIFDQPDNLNRMKIKGAANIVDIATLDRSVFLNALQEVLHEPSYRMNMQRLSRLHHDQPIKPLDRALFWIEFVMRHKGAAHLRTESYRMPWYVYHSVDVIGVLSAAILFILLLTMFVIKYLCCRVLYKRKMKPE